MSNVDFALTIEREVTSWEGVTLRHGPFGTVEFRFGSITSVSPAR